jgi:hypothetical protein
MGRKAAVLGLGDFLAAAEKLCTQKTPLGIAY